MSKNTRTAEFEITNDLRDYIESLQYETNARKDLLAFMLERGQGETEGFKKYHTEYIEYSTQYEMAKAQITNEYVIPKYGKNASWNLDFKTATVTVTYTEQTPEVTGCSCGCCSQGDAKTDE